MRFGFGYDCSGCFWEAETIHSKKTRNKTIPIQNNKKTHFGLPSKSDQHHYCQHLK